MISDVFILTTSDERFAEWQKVMPMAKHINAEILGEDELRKILKNTLTKYFFVIRGYIDAVSDIDIEYTPDIKSKSYVHLWDNSDVVRLYNRRAVKKGVTKYTDDGIRAKECDIKVLMDSEYTPTVCKDWDWYDTIEQGVEQCTEQFFLVKDPHVAISDSFDKNFLPMLWDADKVHVFQRANPSTDDVIDYGGVLLYPTFIDSPDKVECDIVASSEREYCVVVVEDINDPVEVFNNPTITGRFAYAIDKDLHYGSELEEYPTLFDSDIVHMWRTSSGIPSAKLIPLTTDDTKIKEMDTPYGAIPTYETYETIEDGYESCHDSFFWVKEPDVDLLETFDTMFYVLPTMGDGYWWKSPDWDQKKINCFKTLNLDGRTHSTEGLMLVPTHVSEPDRKFFDEVAGIKKVNTITPDIVFLSYDEEFADENYATLLARYPSAKRVHGVKGIFEAHKRAAEISTTEQIFVIDADAILVDGFDLDEAFAQTENFPDDTVFVWRSINPVNDLEYGYGGLKLFPRQKMVDATDWKIDFSTSLSGNFKPFDNVSNITAFNTNEFNAWKSGFRECVKLASKVITKQDNNETEERLQTWCEVNNGGAYAEFAIKGSVMGKKYGEMHKHDTLMLSKINDFQWLKEQFDEIQTQ